MQNLFFQTICRVGIFMICAQAMIHFRPQEAYEKYLKLLVSIMVMIQLFLPVGSFLLGGGGQQAADMLEQFKGELEENMADAERKAAEAEAVLEQMTLAELRRRLEEQENGAGEKAEAAEDRQGGKGTAGEGEAEERAGSEGGGPDERAGSGAGTMGAQERAEETKDRDREWGHGSEGIEIEDVTVEPVAPISIGGASP